MNPVAANVLVETLGSALSDGGSALETVPEMVKKIIKEEAWKDFVTRTGQHPRHQCFVDFVTTKPTSGLGASLDLIERLVQDDAEALRMFREVMKPEPGRNQHSSVDNVNAPKTPKGNSRAYTLDRLHREAPELYCQVVDKKISANRAAIQAGFRKEKTPFEQLMHWWKKANSEERESFLAWTNT